MLHIFEIVFLNFFFGTLLFFAQRGVYNFPKDSKKVKIFEIGSLEVCERGGGGGAQGLH